MGWSNFEVEIIIRRASAILIVTLFLAGILLVPAGPSSNSQCLQVASQSNATPEQLQESAWLPAGKSVRVALYNETNTTMPAYAPGNSFTNYEALYNLLAGAGYQVTRITFQDILNHELNTANFDVLVLGDTVPRENITNLVKEFYLGGGGILSFDSGIAYLGYAGILPRETEGVSAGNGTYWTYHWGYNNYVSSRHPVTKSHQLFDMLSYPSGGFAAYNWTALKTTSVAPYLTNLTSDSDNANWITSIAMDCSDMGGRVVQLGIPVQPWQSGWESIMIDAVEWLCPQPKGRVLFDLSHHPFYGVDAYDYDSGYTQFSYLHTILRNDIVSRRYTFDKLYPSSQGNLTTTNLEPYDIVIELGPYLNFTAQEVNDVSAWVSGGGSLFVISDFISNVDHNLNYLLSNTNLRCNTTIGKNDLYPSGNHVTQEGALHMSCLSPGTVNYTAPAFPIWDDGTGNVVLALQDFGHGRIAIASDVWIFNDNAINNDDNRVVAVNLINWLSAGDVLVFAGSSGGSANPNGLNPFRGPEASALDELGIPFLLTSVLFYFNLSLSTEQWTLVIFDQPGYSIIAPEYCSSILSYLKAGGKIIMSSWQMDTDSYPVLTPLYDYLGVTYAGNYFLTPPTIYIWDNSHPIFNIPRNYGANNLTTSYNYVNRDCTNLTVLANGTALAGLSPGSSTTNASIVLGANGRAITNGMLLTAYSDDTDDSTYSDAFEIYSNEIAYLLRPSIDHPADISMEYGVTGQKVTWTPTSSYPASLTVKENSVQIVGISWDGGPYSILLDNYLPGAYTFDVEVSDVFGGTATDTVVVTVHDTTAPSLNTAPTNLQYEAGTAVHLLNWNFTDLLPDSYWLLIDNGTVQSDNWNGSLISVDVGGLSEGTYNVTLAVNDTSGNMASSSVVLTVTAATTTSSTTTTTTAPTETGSTSQPPIWGDSITWLLMIIAAIAVVVVIVVIVSRRRK